VQPVSIATPFTEKTNVHPIGSRTREAATDEEARIAAFRFLDAPWGCG
jgi:hypothetical protein